MQKTQPHKTNRTVTYRDKTNFTVRTGTDIFYGEFFQKEDVHKIISSVFKNDQPIEAENFREILNNVTSFSSIVGRVKLKPGKSDKKDLVRRICKIAEKLVSHLDILTNRYAYETYKHISLVIQEERQWKEINTYEFLSRLKKDLLYLVNIRNVAMERIEKDGGKKPGNNSKDAVPSLIYQLVDVYKKLTGKNARENFQQDPAREPPFKGQFYDFVCCVFEIINANYQVRYPDIKTPNPFEIKSKNKNDEESHSLGKYVLKVFKMIKNSKNKRIEE